jgi:hypothetical protein
MPSPLQHLEAGSLIGSWPLALAPSFSAPTLLPNTLNAQATILGIRKATSYAIGSKSFILDLDPSGGGAPVAHTVSFPAGSYTLAQIITLINTDVVNVTPPISEVAAFDDNGFLRLKSPRSGDNSYIGIRSVFGAEDIFIELGLFSGTVNKGGSLKQAQHVDPSRQIAFPGQLGAQWGETFSIDVFNRAALQLGWNTDLSFALTDLKKVPTLQEETFTGTGGLSYHLNLANPLVGVYTGPVATPTAEQLKDQIVVLDADGNELVKEYENVLSGPTNDYDVEMVQEGNTSSSWKSFVVKSMTATFSDSDVTDNVYVILTNLPGPDTALNNVPLKVVAHLDAVTYPGGYAGVCVVMNLDAATGQRRALSIPYSGKTGRKVEILPLRAEIEAFYSDAGLTTRIEQTQSVLEAQAVAKIEKNNRVRCTGALFVTNGVKAGDLVVWSGASSTDPYSNNGSYRVKTVVDEKVIELVDQNFGPVYLNPNLSGGFGTVTVKTDGNYWRTPYVKFADPTVGGNRTAGRGGIPASGETFKFAYQVGLPLRTSTDPRSVTGSIARGRSVRNDLKADGNTQRQFLRVLGPAPVKFDELTMGRYSDTLEHLFFKLSEEHHTTDRGGLGGINTLGRHSTIRPDIIDFYQGAVNDGKGSVITSGISFTMRPSAADDATAAQVLKLRGRNFANSADLWGISNEGSLGIGRGLIAQHGTNPQDTFPASYGYYDFMVDRLASGRNAIGQLRGEMGHLIVSGTKSRSGTDVGLVDKNVAALHLRYSGTEPFTNPTDWMLAFTRNASGVEANDSQLLKLDLLQLAGGTGPSNVQVWNKDGAVGLNMGTGFGASVTPQTNLHIRARTIADEELLRLEGFSDSQTTVAMSFKPKRTPAYYAFLEMSEDAPGGDWTFDFSTTTDADTDSVGGTVGESFFRWVVNSAAGVGKEVMRAGRLTGVELGHDTRDTAPNALLPRLVRRMADSTVGRTTLEQILPFDTLGKGGLFCSVLDEGDFSWLFSGIINGAGQYVRDGASAAQQTVEWRWQRTSGEHSQLKARGYRGAGASPWAAGAFSDLFELDLVSPFSSNGPSKLRLRDGILEFFSPNSSSGSSNIDPGGFPVINTLYAKSQVKAWGRVSIINGVIQNPLGFLVSDGIDDGFNLNVVTIEGAGSKRLHIRMENPIPDIVNRGAISCHVMSPGLINANDGVMAGTIRVIYGVPNNANALNDTFILYLTENTGGAAANAGVAWDDPALNIVFSFVIFGKQ